MTLNQLRAFLVVATLGTFSAAAAELQMTQPSVSELIKRMEEHYGVKLFVRGARRLVLTPAGTELLPHARQAADAADGADRAPRSLTSRSLRSCATRCCSPPRHQSAPLGR